MNGRKGLSLRKVVYWGCRTAVRLPIKTLSAVFFVGVALLLFSLSFLLATASPAEAARGSYTEQSVFFQKYRKGERESLVDVFSSDLQYLAERAHSEVALSQEQTIDFSEYVSEEIAASPVSYYATSARGIAYFSLEALRGRVICGSAPQEPEEFAVSAYFAEGLVAGGAADSFEQLLGRSFFITGQSMRLCGVLDTGLEGFESLKTFQPENDWQIPAPVAAEYERLQASCRDGLHAYLFYSEAAAPYSSSKGVAWLGEDRSFLRADGWKSRGGESVYRLDSSVHETAREIASSVRGLQKLIAAITGITSVFSAGMVLYFTLVSVQSRQKEIGILRAIGMSRAGIVRMFGTGVLCVMLAACVLTIPVLYGAVGVLNGLLSQTVRYLQPRPYHIVLLFLYTLLLGGSGFWFPMYRLSKKKPIECLRRGR